MRGGVGNENGTPERAKDCHVTVSWSGTEWVARCVQLPACMSYGPDAAQCVTEAYAAIEDHLEYRRTLEAGDD